AGADAATRRGGPGAVAAVRGQREASVASQRGRRTGDPKILVQPPRMYSDAWIQLSRRVPQRLEPLEHRHHRSAENLGLQLGSRAPPAAPAGGGAPAGAG